MKRLILVTISAALFAQAPRTELTDHERVELWGIVGDANKAMEEANRAQQKASAIAQQFQARLNDLRKPHNAIGCQVDISKMVWTDCKAPVPEKK